MTEKVTVMGVNTMPEIDPYHADTGQLAPIALWLNPQRRKCGINAVFDCGAMDASDYHSVTYTVHLCQAPDQDKALEYLKSPKGQDLLGAICDGHTVDWNGRNMVGSLTEGAEEYLNILIDNLNELPESEWELWDVGDWLNQSKLEVTADTTGDELSKMAGEIEHDAYAEKVKLPNVLRHLRSEREWLQDNDECI